MESNDPPGAGPDYAAQVEAVRNPVETGAPALRPEEVALEIQVGVTSTGHSYASGYGNLTAKRLAGALGYRLTSPRPARRRQPACRPRERRSTHRPRARAPGGDDDPLPSDDNPPGPEPRGQAEVAGSGDTDLNVVWREAMARFEMVAEYRMLAELCLIRADWLRGEGRWAA